MTRTFAQHVYSMTPKQLRTEVFHLNNHIIGVARRLGKEHPELCFDPDCDGTCGLSEKDHPYIAYYNTVTGKVNRAAVLPDQVVDDEE